MRKLPFRPAAFLLASALAALAAACSSSDDRSLVVVDVVLGPEVEVPALVRIAAVQNGTVVRSADFAWKPGNRTMQLGLYIPAGITGQVVITATALNSAGAPIVEGTPVTVELAPGSASGPVSMPLGPQVVTPPGQDAGIDTVEADVVEPAIDVGGMPSVDSATVEARAEVAVDVVAIDTTPVGFDATDGVPIAPDAPDVATPSDAVDVTVVPEDAPADGTISGEVGPTPGWQPAVNIESDLVDPSYAPVIAVDPVNEHVYVAWREATAIKVKRWNRTSGVWEKTFVLDGRGDPNGPAIGVDATGAVTVMWGQNTRTNASLDGLWASRTTDGASWSSPAPISTGVGAFDVTLAVARNGTAHAAYNKQSNGWPLHTAYFDGTAWVENPTPIDPNENSNSSDTRIALGASGDGLLIFSKSWGIAATALSGQSFTAPTMLDPNYATISAYDQCLAVNRKGEGMVIWTESSGSNTVLLGRTYQPGQGWGAVLQPIVTASTIGGTGLALDDSGNATILWQQRLATGGANLMAKRGPSSGPWGEVTTLETDNVAGRLGQTTEYAYPSVAVDGSGNVLAVWRKDRSTDTTTTYGAYGTRFGGGVWSSAVELGMKTGLDVPAVAVSVADSGFGAATFAYFSQTTTDADAYNVHVALYR